MTGVGAARRAGIATAAATAAAVAADHAEKSDRDARLPDAVVEAIITAGFTRHFVPRRCGGADGAFADLTDAVALVGRGCVSAAWLGSLTATAGRMAGFLPPGGQDRIWGTGPDPVIVASLNPTGTASRIASGGWRVGGQWPFVSFVDFSDWALVLAPAPEDPRFFAVPRDAYTIRETWSTVGMRATGSHTLVLDEVHVPESMSFARQDLYRGRSREPASVCHRLPHQAVAGLAFAAPILGAARGALAAFGTESGGDGPPGAAMRRSTRQLDYTTAAVETDAAELLLNRVTHAADTGDRDPGTAIRNARDCAYASGLLVAAVDRLVRIAGTAAMADGAVLQRVWRDVHCAASHGTLRFSSKAALFAEHHLPIEGEPRWPKPR